MDSTILAGRLGLTALPVGAAGGTNYAVGGTYTTMAVPGLVSVTQQISDYLASVGGAANPQALYTVSTGNNDLIYYAGKGAVWQADNPTWLADQNTALTAGVAALQRAGARTILVPNTYNSAVYAGPGGDIDPSKADLYARAAAYDANRWASLTAAGVRYVPVDLDSVFRFVVHNPAAFGFTPASVLAANAPSPVTAIVATTANISLEQERTFLFVDGKHVTTAGQQIEADYEYSLLTAPGLVSMLAEGPVQGGLVRTATIQGQIDLSGQHRGPSGVNLWFSAGAGSLDLAGTSGFPDTSGIPFAGSVGLDYRTQSGLILGTAFTGGAQTQTFSQGGGHFDQVDETLSVYAAYRNGPVWGDVIASGGLIQDSLTRKVPLGGFTDEDRADTEGQSLALAVRTGYDLALGPIVTGPVAGMVIQRMHIDGFTESGGVTALSFGSQTRDSVVSQLGWRAMLDLGDWRPFLEAGWSHEWDNPSRTVQAALTTTSAAPSYSTAAAPWASDWGTATVGSSYRISEQVLVRTTVSATFATSRMASYGGELGVSIGF
jgi:outer membrane lipase/esterase